MAIIAPLASVMLVASITAPNSATALQQVTSGPQPGEKAPAFNVLLTDGSPVLREVEQKTSGAVTVVFLTAVERSAMPLVMGLQSTLRSLLQSDRHSECDRGGRA